jgi:hypothetical protein
MEKNETMTMCESGLYVRQPENFQYAEQWCKYMQKNMRQKAWIM